MLPRSLIIILTLCYIPFLGFSGAIEKSNVKSEKTKEKAPEVYPELADIILGVKNSPVKLVEYSSITCVHCAHFHSPHFFDDLKANYIDSGKIQFVLRHFPLEYYAVEYMSIIAKQPQDKWLPMLDKAFETQIEWLGEHPLKLAKILGISEKDCKAARKCKHIKELIMAKRFNAEQVIDINATPTFHIFYKVKGIDKNLLINNGILPKDLMKKLDEIIKIADKI